LGLKLELPDFHSALAIASLKGLNEQLEHNKSIYYTYKENIKNINGIRLIEYSEEEKRTFKNILIEIEDDFPISRNKLINILHSNNIISRPYYYPPLHEMERDYQVKNDSLPNTDYWKNRLLLMPCGYFVNIKDVSKITDLLKLISSRKKDEQ